MSINVLKDKGDLLSTMQIDKKEIEKALDVLRSGGLVAFPTETVYGLGADASNAQAVKKIFSAKGRPEEHPLIVHLGRKEDVNVWAVNLPEQAHLLAEHFWPGPLTMIFKKADRVPEVVTGGLDTVGLRVPHHPVALALLQAFKGGIAAPSANRFGKVSPTTAIHVKEELGDRVDFILDGGACEVGIESTIVDFSSGSPVILRPGSVTKESLENVLQMPVPHEIRTTVRCPGQHLSHYAPNVPIVLASKESLDELIIQYQSKNQKVGVMVPKLFLTLSKDITRIDLPESFEDQAQKLYKLLRHVDTLNIDVLMVVPPKALGVGRAILDRLRRAAGQGAGD